MQELLASRYINKQGLVYVSLYIRITKKLYHKPHEMHLKLKFKLFQDGVISP